MTGLFQWYPLPSEWNDEGVVGHPGPLRFGRFGRTTGTGGKPLINIKDLFFEGKKTRAIPQLICRRGDCRTKTGDQVRKGETDCFSTQRCRIEIVSRLKQCLKYVSVHVPFAERSACYEWVSSWRVRSFRRNFVTVGNRRKRS